MIMGQKRKRWGTISNSTETLTLSKPRRIITNPGSKTKQPLIQEEQERILAVAKDMGEFEYRTLLIFLDTGMHPCVLAGDCKDTVPNLMVWNGEVLRWNRPKNKEVMELLIPKRLKPWIEEYLKSERPNYRQWYNRLIKEIGQKAGISKLSPLSLRHTFAINRLDQGYDIGELKKLMGTKSIRSLEHYLGMSAEHMKKRYRGREW